MGIERMADYLRWVAPSILTIVLFPAAVVGTGWLSAIVTKAWLVRQHQVQDRSELTAAIADRDARIRTLEAEAEHLRARNGELTARIRENRALAARLAANHEAVDVEEVTPSEHALRRVRS